MTSKISSFNIAMEDLRQRSWMLALSLLGSFLALPVTFLLANRQFLSSLHPERTNGMTPAQWLTENYYNFFNGDSAFFSGFVLIAGAFIVGICGSRYLYSRRKSDLFHSLPIKRGKLFLIQWLNGFLIWLVPMVLCTMLTYFFALFNLLRVGGLGYAGLVFVGILKTMGILIIAYLTIYHFCLVCTAFCGNALNALCSTLLLGSAVMILYGLIHSLCDELFDTFVSLPFSPEQLVWASPIVNGFWVLNLTDVLDSVFGSQTNAALPSLFYLGMTLLVLAGNLGLAYRLFVKRPSELAERGICRPSAQHMMRLLAGFFGGICGAMFFSFIVGPENALGWQLFGGILFGGFAFGVMDIIMQRSFRTFFAHKWEMISCIAVSCLFFLSFIFDWIGYNTRIPAREQIQSATVGFYYYTDDSYVYELDRSGNLMRKNSSDYLPDIGFTDVDQIYALLQAAQKFSTDYNLSGPYAAVAESGRSSYLYLDPDGPSTLPDDINSYFPRNYQIRTFTIQVKLKSGLTFLRQYQISDASRELLRPFLENDGYRENFYKLSSGLLGLPESMDIETRFSYRIFPIKEKTQISAIMEAYQKDFLEHYCLEELDDGCSPLRFSLNFPGSNYGFSLDVYETYTNTMEVLQSIFPDYPLSMKDFVQKDLTEGRSLSSIEVSLDLGTTDKGHPIPITRESLGSYFGLEGYPDFATYQLQLDEEYQEKETEAQENPENEEESGEEKRVYDETVIYEEISLSITEKEDLRDLTDFLHAGRLNSAFLGTSGGEYIQFGSGVTEEERSFPCYVKKGELPQEWIDRLLEQGTIRTYY